MPCYVYVNDLTPLTAAAKTIAGQKVCYGDIVIVNPVIMKVGGIAAGSFSKIVLASPSEFPYSTSSHGGVAQLGERLTGSQEVRGSIPLVSTIVNSKGHRITGGLFSYQSTPQTTVTRAPAPTSQKVAQLPSRFCTKFVSQA